MTIQCRRFGRVAAALLVASFTSSCASFGRGVAEAILGGGDEVEERICKIEGAEFRGLRTAFKDTRTNTRGASGTSRQTMRMLIIHGIGPHSEDYSETLVKGVANQLDLGNRDQLQKHIALTATSIDPLGLYEGELLGSLTITRYTDDIESKELLAFELLWSDYNAEARKGLLDADKDTAKLRAGVNETVKEFFNTQVVDPVKYLGDNSETIRLHVRQAACWMISADWNEYPDWVGMEGAPPKVCPAINSSLSLEAQAQIAQTVDNITNNDEFVAVTHSLGSRIFLDAFSMIDEGRTDQLNPFEKLGSRFRDRDATVIMLANQLPLLQLGLNDKNGFGTEGLPWKNADRYNGDNFSSSPAPGEYPGFPKVSSKAELCTDDRYAWARRFSKLSLISVSDPNDLLSYRLLKGEFTDNYIDWGLCASVTEVTIGVAPATSLFGLEFADPSKAHGNYWTDAGLVQLLVDGFDQDDKNPKFAADKKGRPIKPFESKEVRVRYQCEGTVFKEKQQRQLNIS